MKASWKGSISFGMVYFLKRIYHTSGADGVGLNYLHKNATAVSVTRNTAIRATRKSTG